jgi:transcription antitermination factor NusG
MQIVNAERGEARPDVSRFDPNHWHVLWTRSNFEQRVDDQLRGKGFETFLPRMRGWGSRGSVRRRSEVPMFPGYLFVRGVRDHASHVEVRKARGLVQMLGQRWDCPAVVPEGEVGALQKLSQSSLDSFAIPFVREGQAVRVVAGPLAGIEGTLVRTNARTGLLVLSVNLLQRSVAAEVHCSAVLPI